MDKQLVSNDNNNDLDRRFYELECALNDALRLLGPRPSTRIYYLDEYPLPIHREYLRRFLDGPKKLMFVGENPGLKGMINTGVPFGNITTVRDTMNLDATGSLSQNIPDEQSGKRLWGLLKGLSNDSLDTFFRQCFVHNFCPLAFECEGCKVNVTLSKIKGPYQKAVETNCLATTEHLLQLVQPEIILGVGRYVCNILKKNSEYCKQTGIRLIYFPHPSPLSAKRATWFQHAQKVLTDNDLLPYLRNA